MHEMIQVLVVEDDFRIAEINRQVVNQIDGFTVLHAVKTGEEALAYLRNNKTLPHLILLDVYIPDTEGLNLFWQLRKEYKEIDVIMVTAAKEVVTIADTLRGGIFDYLVKPIDFVRFEQTLNKYRKQRAIFTSREELEQEEIDRLIGFPTLTPLTEEASVEMNPKGIDNFTLEKIKNIMQLSGESGITALDAGNRVGVSRSTARRYLEYLVSIREAEAQLKYGEVGRPERRYYPRTK